MTTTLPSSNGQVVGQLVSVPRLVAALRRRWKLWMCGAALGTLAALAFSLASPPKHTATTVLLLQHQSQTDGAKAMLTDARLVQSRTVAQGVVDRLSLKVSARQLVDQYQPRILSDDLLQIQVTAPSGPEAVRRAEAISESFLAFRRAEVQRQTSVALKNLEDRQQELTTQLATVNDGINARTGAEGDELRVLGDLLVRRSVLNDQLGSVRQRIELATADTDSIIEKSRIVDPAGEDPRSTVRPLAVNVVAGVILGLLLSTGWIVLHEATTDHLRRREDVATALGAPIAANLLPRRGPLWVQRWHFRRLLAHPPPDLGLAVRHLCTVVGQARSSKLVLVSVDSDAAAAVALAATTVQLMAQDRSVLVVDLTRRNILARLTKAHPEEPDRLPLVGSQSALWISFPPHRLPQPALTGESDLRRELTAQVDVVLALATVDPAVGANHLSEVAGTAVVVATAGRSSAVSLCSVAQMIDAAGLRLHSTLLIGADRRDESVGLLERRTHRSAATGDRLKVGS